MLLQARPLAGTASMNDHRVFPLVHGNVLSWSFRQIPRRKGKGNLAARNRSLAFLV